MTSTTSTGRPALTMITAAGARRTAPASSVRRPHPASAAHLALQARLVRYFG